MLTQIPIELLIGIILPVVILAGIFISSTLYISLIFNTLLTGVEFGLLYPRIIIFLVLFVSLCYKIVLRRERVEIPYHIKMVFFLLLTFAFWSLTIDISVGLLNSSVTSILKRLSRAFLPILIVFCTLGICNSLEKARKFLLFFLICASISAFVGFMQFLDFDFFWMLRTSQTKVLGTVGVRATGLANQAVGFSYILTLAFPWAMAFTISDELRQKWPKSLMLILLLFLCIGTLSSLTRSAILGCVLGGIYIIWKFKGTGTLRAILPIGVLVIIVFFIGMGKFQRITSLEDKSATGRLPLAVTGINFAVKHPLGVGSFDNRYLNVLRAEKDYYLNAVRDYKGAGSIFHLASHNHFINALVFWGWPGLALLLLCLFFLFQGSKSLIKNKKTEINCYGVAFRGMLIAYITNAFFHNGGPFLGDYLFWYFPGILGAILTEGVQTKQVLRIHSV